MPFQFGLGCCGCPSGKLPSLWPSLLINNNNNNCCCLVSAIILWGCLVGINKLFPVSSNNINNLSNDHELCNMSVSVVNGEWCVAR